MIGQIIFDSEGLGANRNLSGKLGMKLAIRLLHCCNQHCRLIYTETCPSLYNSVGSLYFVSVSPDFICCQLWSFSNEFR